MTQAQHPTTASAISQATTQFGSLAEIESILTVPATGNPKTLSSSSTTNPSPSLEKLNLPYSEPNPTNFKILQPNHNSPLLSNNSAIKTPTKSVKTKQYVVKKPFPPITVEPLLSTHTVSLPTSPSAFNTPSFVPMPNQKIFPSTAHISSDKPQKPSLKRTRSSPTISPTAPPKIIYQSSKPSPDLSFPVIGTLRHHVSPDRHCSYMGF
ncbi:hypothetical protein YC2023_002246 [Brassica napus]